jgi:hypothetical protein
MHSKGSKGLTKALPRYWQRDETPLCNLAAKHKADGVTMGLRGQAEPHDTDWILCFSAMPYAMN